MGEISEVKEDLESTRNTLREKCECNSDLEDLRNNVEIAENVFKEIKTIESEIEKIQYIRLKPIFPMKKPCYLFSHAHIFTLYLHT